VLSVYSGGVRDTHKYIKYIMYIYNMDILIKIEILIVEVPTINILFVNFFFYVHIK